MIRSPFVLPCGGGAEIRGEVRFPSGPPPFAAIVLVHGFKGFKDWGFFPYVAETLVADGFAVVSFNFSLGGVSSGAGDFDRLEDFARNTLTREVEELHRVLAEVRGAEGAAGDPGRGSRGAIADLLPRPIRRVGILGHSRGGGMAVLLARETAAARQEGASFAGAGNAGGGAAPPEALVTWGAVARFDRWSEETREEWRRSGRIYVLNTRTGQQLPLDVSLLEDYERNARRLDVLGAAAAIECPWLVVHGEADLTVGVEDARALVRANPAARLELIPGAGHTFEARHPFEGTTPALERALDATRRHFRRHLAPERATVEVRDPVGPPGAGAPAGPGGIPEGEAPGAAGGAVARLASERARRMARRIESAAREAGVRGGDGVIRLLEAYRVAMAWREARPGPAGDHEIAFLHPGRTVLVLLQDVEVRDPAVLAAGALAESRDLELRVPEAAAEEVLGGWAELWRELPPVPWGGATPGDDDEAAADPGDAAGADHDELLERLVTAPEAVVQLTLAEALDHIRHAHLWESREARRRALALAREVFGPVAARAHPTLERRFAWWIRRVGGNARRF